MQQQQETTRKPWSERVIGLNPMGRRAFLAAGIGWGLDAFDWTMYSFALPALIATMGISDAEGSYVATAALVASAFGGVLGGILADRFGRTRVLVYVIVGFAVFSALSATSQDLAQLTIWRTLLGFAYGAEWAVGAALLAEYARPEQRGRLMGVLQSCYAIGWAASTAVYLVVFATMPEGTAWRVLFLVGIIPALAALYIRSRTQDAVQVRKTTKQSPLLLFKEGRARNTVFATLLGTGVQGIYYSVIVFLPLFLTDVRHISVIGTATYTWFAIIGSFVGYVCAGFLHDAIGRRPAFTTFFVGSAISICLFVTFPISGVGAGLAVTFALGFFASGQISGMGSFLAELFPTEIRATGQGFCYNVGRGLAAGAPAGVGAMSAAMGLGTSILIVGLVTAAIAIFATWMLPETRGQELVSLTAKTGDPVRL